MEITIKQYHDRINELVEESFVKSPPKKKPKSWKKSKGIRWGKKAEPALVEFLKKHPNYKGHKEQVRHRPVGGTSCVDVVFETKTGKTVYIPVVKDSWTGTAQIDRLETTYYKWKGGFVKDYNFCFLIVKDYKERLKETFKEGTVKELIVNDIIKEMADAKVLFNIETLWEHLKTL